MTEENIYDVLIIGAGQAAIPLAHALAGVGMRVCLVERKHLGGSCVNFGCTPTKAALASARVAYQARRAATFGLRIPTVEVDFAGVLARAKSIVQQSRRSIKRGFENSANPQLIYGHARLEGRDEAGFLIRVEDRLLTAKQVVLDTGTRSRIPTVEGMDKVKVITAGTWLDETVLPEHVVIIGSGSTGLEMSQFYRRMGSRATVVDHNQQIAKDEDEDVAEVLQRSLAAEEIRFYLQTEVRCVETDGTNLVIKLEGHAPTEIKASHLFVATGRHPNTDDLGLETIGVEVTDKGFVKADARLSTSVQGVWVAGDIRGGPMYTHTAWDDHRVLESQIAGDGSRTTERIVPYAFFTDPELGRVALTERDARRSGKRIKVGRYEMKKNGRAAELGDTDGFIKVVIDADTDRILGASTLAIEGAELIHTIIGVMNADAPVAAIRDAIHIHPTLSEAVQSAVYSIKADE
ncbi:MAG: mercuric reductase [Pyrinomonadaceae bacterium]|nr:mercuric reductase [Pyrinomonadaceae bacterium]